MVLVIEGTWDEIKSHESEFAGRHLRLFVDAEPVVDTGNDINSRVRGWNEFVANGIDGIVIDDSREAIYSDELGRG